MSRIGKRPITIPAGTEVSVASHEITVKGKGGTLKKTIHDVAQIVEKINNGSGTLGALVNDPSLYEDARSLVGGANRNRIIRNLVRKTTKDGDAGK